VSSPPGPRTPPVNKRVPCRPHRHSLRPRPPSVRMRTGCGAGSGGRPGRSFLQHSRLSICRADTECAGWRSSWSVRPLAGHDSDRRGRCATRLPAPPQLQYQTRRVVRGRQAEAAIMLARVSIERCGGFGSRRRSHLNSRRFLSIAASSRTGSCVPASKETGLDRLQTSAKRSAKVRA
jgi:hypothetical protein